MIVPQVWNALTEALVFGPKEPSIAPGLVFHCPDAPLVSTRCRLRTTSPVDPAFKVGIVWQGNPRHKWDRRRSVRLTQFEPLAAVPGVRLISLQKRDGVDQLDRLPPGMQVTTLGDDFDAGPDAFLDTAAVMAGV